MFLTEEFTQQCREMLEKFFLKNNGSIFILQSDKGLYDASGVVLFKGGRGEKISKTVKFKCVELRKKKKRKDKNRCSASIFVIYHHLLTTVT